MDPQTPMPVAPEDSPAPVADVRQHIASSILNGKNVLVTVKGSPSVDELASALGLTFLLGKLDKHATAVFSGKIPSAMEFLDPENIFENTVDSLRDFIIALDKEKADKLRYKVEDDVVKVFITPYKTVISEKDLTFSQGDFNVDVVIALGVIQREELDKAILAHGRILHDAVVITINAGSATSNLGSIDWHDESASSVAEMLVSLSEVLGADKLDAQISTALLTGVVAETNRFSNDKTSPKVMNVAAQLMAAGANQQLIATNLRQEGMISQPIRSKKDDQPGDDDGEMVLDHTEGDDTENRSNDSGKSEPVKDESAKKPKASKKPQSTSSDKEAATPEGGLRKALDTASEYLEPKPEPVATDKSSPEPTPAITAVEKSEYRHKVIEPLSDLPEPPIILDEQPALPTITASVPRQETEKPMFGGTLNATTAEEEEKNREAASLAAATMPTLEHTGATSESTQTSVDEARKAVEEAAFGQPFNPAGQPLQAINASPLPSIEPEKSIDSTASQVQTAATPLKFTDGPSPVDAFMQPQATPNELTAGFKINAPGTPPNQPAAPIGMPPLPPLPDAPAATSSPYPPLPGQPVPDPVSAVQPQINPGFMQGMPGSVNPWTQAGDELAAKRADTRADRQQKMDTLSQQYDKAQDRNRELQGLPPLNNPNGSGLPPVPPKS